LKEGERRWKEGGRRCVSQKKEYYLIENLKAPSGIEIKMSTI
jgi:hypothetical protein